MRDRTKLTSGPVTLPLRLTSARAVGPGAAVALMVWLYWTAFAMLIGAELNAELAKRTQAGPIEQQPEPPVITKLDLSA